MFFHIFSNIFFSIFFNIFSNIFFNIFSNIFFNIFSNLFFNIFFNIFPNIFAGVLWFQFLIIIIFPYRWIFPLLYEIMFVSFQNTGNNHCFSIWKNNWTVRYYEERFLHQIFNRKNILRGKNVLQRIAFTPTSSGIFIYDFKIIINLYIDVFFHQLSTVKIWFVLLL